MRPALVVLLILTVACSRPVPAAAPPPPHLVQTVSSSEPLAAGEGEVSMEVIELMCRPCAQQIVQSSKELPGVTSVRMELATKTLTLRFEMSVTAAGRVTAEVEDIVARVQ